MLNIICNTCGREYLAENEHEIDTNCMNCGTEHDFMIDRKNRVKSEDFTVEIIEDGEEDDLLDESS